jgi:hypothetical protein
VEILPPFFLLFSLDRSGPQNELVSPVALHAWSSFSISLHCATADLPGGKARYKGYLGPGIAGSLASLPWPEASVSFLFTNSRITPCTVFYNQRLAPRLDPTNILPHIGLYDKGLWQ